MLTPHDAGGSALPSRSQVQGARTAVGWVFALNGFAVANWVSRLPAIRDNLHLTPGGLGLVLLAGSAGSVGGLPLSGMVVHRIGAARAVGVFSALCMAGMVGIGLAPSVAVLVVVLFTFGLGMGIWDVAMNVEGAQVEREVQRPIMPRFHAAFSLGTVVGALTGAGAAAVALEVRLHLVTVALLVAAAVAWCTRRFLPWTAEPTHPEIAGTGSAPDDASRRRGSGAAVAWRERRTLLVGLLVLGMALSEGAANDWLALGLIDGYGVQQAVGAIGFGVFVTAMTVARMTGPWTLERYGRVTTLRGGAVAVLAGIGLLVLGGHLRPGIGLPAALVLAAIGAFAWGIGSALGFPVGISAASDDPVGAAARVSVVSTIGYTAFLAGPPLLGRLADHVGILNSLLGVAVAVVTAFVCAGAARPEAVPSGIGRTVDP